jgi:hypothetical protein
MDIFLHVVETSSSQMPLACIIGCWVVFEIMKPIGVNRHIEHPSLADQTTCRMFAARAAGSLKLPGRLDRGSEAETVSVSFARQIF